MAICKNKYMDVATKTILFSAITHIFLLIIHALFRGDYIVLNYFNILDLDLFFPGIINGIVSQILSIIVIVGIFTFFFMYKRK